MALRVLIALAGSDLSVEARRAWAAGADVVIAADGGADRLREAGLRYDVLVGDFDSASDAAHLAECTRVHLTEQDSTDFEKALRYVEVNHPESEVLVTGSEGTQADHVLYSWFAAARASVRVAFGLRAGVAMVIRASSGISFTVPVGSRVSLLPIVPTQCVRLTGVEWPLEEVEIKPLGPTSISNRSTGVVELEISTGVALLFLEAEPGAWPSELVAANRH